VITSFNHNNRSYSFSTEFDDHIFKVLVKNKTFYEIKLLNKIKSFDLTGTVLDVGANIGNHTVYFSTQCKFDSVHSFEMNNVLFGILNNNVELNKCQNVICYNLAVADKSGRVGSSTLNTLNTGAAFIVPDGDIEQVALDNMSYENKVSLIKIDVEGYESKVLSGAVDLIRLHKPILVVECADNFTEINSFLSKFNYKTDKVDYAATPTYIWKP
jgi:FkbM family methyltransferase